MNLIQRLHKMIKGRGSRSLTLMAHLQVLDKPSSPLGLFLSLLLLESFGLMNELPRQRYKLFTILTLPDLHLIITHDELRRKHTNRQAKGYFSLLRNPIVTLLSHAEENPREGRSWRLMLAETRRSRAAHHIPLTL